MAEQHSHQGWYNVLVRKAEAEELTLSESMLLALHNIQNHLFAVATDGHQARAAVEHLEGMVGAIDLLANEVAARSGMPYAASGRIREALDHQRDALRGV